MIEYLKTDISSYRKERQADFDDFLDIHTENERSFLIMCPGDEVYCNSCDCIISDEFIFINKKLNYVSCDSCREQNLKEILDE